MFATNFYNVFIPLMGHCYNFVMIIVNYITRPVSEIFNLHISFYNPYFDNMFSIGIDFSEGIFGVVTGIVSDFLSTLYGADTQIWVMLFLLCATAFVVFGIYKAFK